MFWNVWLDLKTIGRKSTGFFTLEFLLNFSLPSPFPHSPAYSSQQQTNAHLRLRERERWRGGGKCHQLFLLPSPSHFPLFPSGGYRKREIIIDTTIYIYFFLKFFLSTVIFSILLSLSLSLIFYSVSHFLFFQPTKSIFLWKKNRMWKNGREFSLFFLTTHDCLLPRWEKNVAVI